jgi:ankyrin repeat protein
LVKFKSITTKLEENTVFMDNALLEYPLRVSYLHCMMELVRQLDRNPSKVQAVKLNYDLLLESVEEIDEHGETPLHAACNDGVSEDRIRLLLLAGADVNCTSTNGMTPLLSLSYFGRANLASMLVGKVADVAAVVKEGTESGATAVFYAAKGGHSANGWSLS